MKKLLATISIALMALTFNPQAIFAAEPVAEAPVEEVIEEPIDYDAEVDAFMADLNITLSQVFAWIGGFSGLAALLAFAFRYIKDRGIMKELRASIQSIQNGAADTMTAMNAMVETIKGYTDRNAVMEKGIIHMITISNLDSKLKEEVISGLKNDTIDVQDVLNAGLLQIQEEVASKAVVQAEINMAASSLLEQLSKDADKA